MTYTNNPYCAVADVQSALFTPTAGVMPTLSAPDINFIQSLIDEAQSFIDEEIGHSYQSDGTAAAPATRLFDGNDMDKLWIGEFQSFSQVLENTVITELQGGVWIQVQSPTPLDITVDCVAGPYSAPNKLWIKRLSGLEFLHGIQNYTVKGVFGVTTVPSDIKRACARLVAHWYRMRATNYANAVSTQGQVTQHYSHNIPDDVMAILDNHHRRYFATGR